MPEGGKTRNRGWKQPQKGDKGGAGRALVKNRLYFSSNIVDSVFIFAIVMPSFFRRDRFWSWFGRIRSREALLIKE